MGQYVPGTQDPELARISQALSSPNDTALLNVLYKAPAKTKPGALVVADGTSWNPGSGAGLYLRNAANNAWLFLADKATLDAGLAGKAEAPNLLINGDMRIDQHNAGASVAVSSANNHVVDCWKAYAQTGTGHTGQRVADGPAGSGFTNSLKVTIGTGAAPAAGELNLLYQPVEGLNIANLEWGSASAANVAIGFWVKSSSTGNFGVSIVNGSVNRGYPSQFTINSANTWEYKTLTIAGDTTGTWASDAGTGWYVGFDLGSGANYEGTLNTWGAGNYKRVSGQIKLIATSGATLNITGIRVVRGSSAADFERRPYDVELRRCQRYLRKQSVWVGSSTAPTCFPIDMRATPTISGGAAGFASTGTTADTLICSQTTPAAQTLTLTAELA